MQGLVLYKNKLNIGVVAMRIVGKFTDEELELLENLGIEVRDREYSDYEIKDMEDIVMDAVMSNLDNEGEFTEIAETYNWIHDKLVQIENDKSVEEIPSPYGKYTT